MLIAARVASKHHPHAAEIGVLSRNFRLRAPLERELHIHLFSRRLPHKQKNMNDPEVHFLQATPASYLFVEHLCDRLLQMCSDNPTVARVIRWQLAFVRSRSARDSSTAGTAGHIRP
jgi:hypothetical protein